MTSRRSFLRLGALSVVGLAGCATDGAPGTSTPDDAPGTQTPDGDTPGTATPLPADATVGMSCNVDEGRYYFAPDLVRVRVGGTVSWAPTSPCRQSTVAYHPDNDAPLRIPEGPDPWESPPIQGDRGGSFEHTFETPGVYDYFGLHEGAGQVGTVVVGDPDPEGQPGLSEPGDEIPEAARAKLRDLNERTRELL